MKSGIRFQEELDALRIGGGEFARLNPKLAKHLGNESADPDVDRLLEGLAFLSSRIREKLDAEVPELDQSMIQLMWPQFFRPSPPFTLLTFRPDESPESKKIPAGARVYSRLIDGVSCEFRTINDCDVAPLVIEKSVIEGDKDHASLKINFKADIPIQDLALDDLRLWFSGDSSTAQNLYLWTRRYLTEVRLHADNKVVAFLSPDAVCSGGFSSEETLLPGAAMAFRGYQILQEYFAFPEKFCCVDIHDFKQHCAHIQTNSFALEFRYERAFPAEVKLRPDDIRLFCVPAVNLFRADAEPLAVDHRKVTYPVTVQDTQYTMDEEIFSIDSVCSWRADEDGRAVKRIYPRFESFAHESEYQTNEAQAYYREVLKPRGAGLGFQHELSFILHHPKPALPVEETLSIELTCFNRFLASELAIGDVCIQGEGIPDGMNVWNVTRPTLPVFPSLDGALDWTLIAGLSLNYMTLLDLQALTAIMSIYDALPASDRRAEQVARKRTEGMVSLTTVPQERIFNGLPIRGLRSVLELREDCFQTEGDMYLFASSIAEFFRLYTTANAFHELEVRGVLFGEVYQWSAIIGR